MFEDILDIFEIQLRQLNGIILFRDTCVHIELAQNSVSKCSAMPTFSIKKVTKQNCYEWMLSNTNRTWLLIVKRHWNGETIRGQTMPLGNAREKMSKYNLLFFSIIALM